MKILMIGPSPTRAKGGMSTVIQEIIEDDLFKNNCKIDIYESYIDGCRIKRIVFSTLSFIKFYIKGINRKYDIYHIHVASYSSTFRKILYAKAIKKYKKKIVLHIHGGQYLQFFNQASSKNKKKILSFFNTADVVIALSEKWKKDFETIMGIDNCIVIQNGIDINKYKSAKIFPHILNKKFLFLGRVCEEKGIYDLIKAVSLVKKEHSNICIYVAGEGEISLVSKYIKELGIEENIILVGWLNDKRKIEIMSEVNTLILPSHFEALPMCILEAMACGKSIISTRVGAIPEIVTQKNGILVDVGDVNQIAEGMKICCENIKWMQEVYYSNLDKMNNQFNMEEKHKKLQLCYEELYFNKQEELK